MQSFSESVEWFLRKHGDTPETRKFVAEQARGYYGNDTYMGGSGMNRRIHIAALALTLAVFAAPTHAAKVAPKDAMNGAIEGVRSTPHHCAKEAGKAGTTAAKHAPDDVEFVPEVAAATLTVCMETLVDAIYKMPGIR